MRQAFSTVSVDSFIHATPAERDFLGRVSQGFFAFHSLGVFGEVAIERFKKAKESVWLVDSNIQIPALAFAAPTNPVFVDCFSRLRDAGIRLFSTYNIFQETFNHLYYAMRQVKDYGPDSVEIMGAVLGQAPYARANQFLEGFIRWQAAGNQCDWGNYLYQCFKERQPNENHIRAKLEEIGIEVIDFDMWPGFSDLDYREAGEYAAVIVRLRDKPSASLWLDDEGVEQSGTTNLDSVRDLYKKSLPEAEAFIITKNEREGQYHVLSEPGAQSDAWFISRW